MKTSTMNLTCDCRHAELGGLVFHRERHRLGGGGGRRNVRHHPEAGVRLHGHRRSLLHGRWVLKYYLVIYYSHKYTLP